MATIALGPKNCRLDMRMTHDQRQEVERAAAVKGKSLTQWCLDNLLADARRDIQDEATTRLSARTFEDFLKALDEGMPEEAVQLLGQKRAWE